MTDVSEKLTFKMTLISRSHLQTFGLFAWRQICQTPAPMAFAKLSFRVDGECVVGSSFSQEPFLVKFASFIPLVFT